MHCPVIAFLSALNFNFDKFKEVRLCRLVIVSFSSDCE